MPEPKVRGCPFWFEVVLADRTKVVVLVMLKMVAPAGIPAPDTGIPTARPWVLPPEMVALPLVRLKFNVVLVTVIPG